MPDNAVIFEAPDEDGKRIHHIRIRGSNIRSMSMDEIVNFRRRMMVFLKFAFGDEKERNLE